MSPVAQYFILAITAAGGWVLIGLIARKSIDKLTEGRR